MKKVDYIIVLVSDMKRSVEFYRDALGLTLKFESPEWTAFLTEGTTLALHPGAKRVEPNAGLAEDGGKQPNLAGTCQPGFQVEDIEAFHQKLTAKGVRCIRPPRLEEFGSKLAVYADPDGLPISVTSPSK